MVPSAVFASRSCPELESALARTASYKTLILPTSSRVPQVYETVIGVQYPMLCNHGPTGWSAGTGTRRTDYSEPTGFRYIFWDHDKRHVHEVNRDDAIWFNAGRQVWNGVMEQHQGFNTQQWISNQAIV